jgi:hypothetical protein
VHFRCARIHETGVDAVGGEGVKKNFCSCRHSPYYVAPPIRGLISSI